MSEAHAVVGGHQGLRVALIDDSPDDRALALRELERVFPGVEPVMVGSAAAFERLLERNGFEVVVTDYQLGWSNGLEVLRTLKARYPDRPVIMFTNSGNEEIAVEAMKAGLDDYIVKKPSYFVRLPLAVRSALHHRLARREAADALEARERFLLIAAHELGTPLTAISTTLQLLRKRVHTITHADATRDTSAPGAEPLEWDDWLADLLEPMVRLLERAERQAQQIERFTAYLQEVAQLRGDRLTLREVVADLRGPVRSAVEAARAVWPVRSVALELPEAAVVVRADTGRIEHVVLHFLTNAFKYSAPDTTVRVRVVSHGWAVRVSVADQGPGLDAAEQERVWLPFYQVVGQSHRDGSSVGLGLGLYVSRAIVEQHGGQVGVESPVGEGATFWFTLPLAEGDESGI